MTSKFKEWGADFLLLLVAVSWGCTFLPVQKAVDEAPVYLFLFWRFGFATLLMALLAIKHLRHIDKKSIQGGMVLGVALFLGFAFQTFGLKYTFSSTVAFITGLNVIIVPLFVFLLFKTTPSRYSNIGAFIAAIGLYYLTANTTLGFGIGEFYTLICAFMFAGQIALTSYYVKHCNIYTLVVVQLFTVTLLSFFGALFFDKQIVPNEFSDIFLFAVILTAVFATVFAFFVQTAMQRFTSPAKTAIIFTMEPVCAGIAGYFYGGEILSNLQIFGAFLILFGVLVAELGTYLKEKRASQQG